MNAELLPSEEVVWQSTGNYHLFDYTHPFVEPTEVSRWNGIWRAKAEAVKRGNEYGVRFRRAPVFEDFPVDDQTTDVRYAVSADHAYRTAALLHEICPIDNLTFSTVLMAGLDDTHPVSAVAREQARGLVSEEAFDRWLHIDPLPVHVTPERLVLDRPELPTVTGMELISDATVVQSLGMDLHLVPLVIPSPTAERELGIDPAEVEDSLFGVRYARPLPLEHRRIEVDIVQEW